MRVRRTVRILLKLFRLPKLLLPLRPASHLPRARESVKSYLTPGPLSVSPAPVYVKPQAKGNNTNICSPAHIVYRLSFSSSTRRRAACRKAEQKE